MERGNRIDVRLLLLVLGNKSFSDMGLIKLSLLPYCRIASSKVLKKGSQKTKLSYGEQCCRIHDLAIQSYWNWKTRFFEHPAWEMHRRLENLPIRLQDTEPL